MKRRFIAIIAVAAMVLTMIPSMAFAAEDNSITEVTNDGAAMSTVQSAVKNGKVYKSCYKIKNSNCVICKVTSRHADHIYKVNVKTGKAVRLVKGYHDEVTDSIIKYMVYRNGNLYYLENATSGTLWSVRCVNVSTGAKKTLVRGEITDFVLARNSAGNVRIFYGIYDYGNRVMKLNGSAKTRSAYEAVAKRYYSNNSNYSLFTSNGYRYLKAPGKKIRICVK